ncbi:unnamed protein product [Pedinophyceae sp. YPF-701]|nr:unnamed protein product [Pedinophyceae sp. YPF-701]
MSSRLLQAAGRHAYARASLPALRQPLLATPLRLRARARVPGHVSRTVSCASSTAGVGAGVRETFDKCREQGRVALIPFIMAGDPDLDTTKKAILELDSLGADIIELGVPYSDPLADGPVIHEAATRALRSGATIDKVIAMVREVAPQIKAPLVLFTYFNPIINRGVSEYCKFIKDAGASALLIPDLPLEEVLKVKQAANDAGIELVLLTTPTTPRDRMAKIAESSDGFVYLVSVTGVTGVRAKVSDRVGGLVEMLKEVTDKPVAVGFGVSAPENVKQIVDWGADGVIVGSALVKALGTAGSAEEGLANFKALAASLREAAPAGK